MPGLKQTVPRAELTAVIKLLQFVDVNQDLEIVTDSKITYRKCRAIEQRVVHARLGFTSHKSVAEKAAVNGDLWLVFESLMQTRNACTSFYWMKANMEDEQIASSRFSVLTIVANGVADKLAGNAAKAVQVAPCVSRPFVQVKRQTLLIQKGC